MIVVQEIVVHWTKASRGADGAAARNRVPEALALPTMSDMKYAIPLLYDEIHFNEEDQFRMSTRQTTVKELILHEVLNFRGAAVRIEKEFIPVTFVNDGWLGAPKRTNYARQVFTLTKGTWGRILHNGRFGWDNDWGYQKTVLNIGYFDQLREDIFLSDPPHMFSEMANLW